MDAVNGGLHRFRDRVDPGLLSEIDAWIGRHPLVRIRSALEARTDEKAFFDALAEAVLARHVLSLGFDVETEVPTVGNMTADLRVSKGGREVFLHVKRVATDIDNRASRQIVISPRLRALEMVPRPWLIRVRWSSVANDRQMQRLVEEGMDFLRHASVGDELKVTDHDGSDLGGIRVLAPHDGRRVVLHIGMPDGFIDHTPRMRKRLDRAFAQFKPGAENAIVVASSDHQDGFDFETALLGQFVERWDRRPTDGRRVAHGRDDLGFWSGGAHPSSRVASWFRLSPHSGEFSPRMWFRQSDLPAPDGAQMLRAIFGEEEPPEPTA